MNKTSTWDRRAALAVVLILAVFTVACIPTLKIYTQTFTRTTTLRIDKAVEDNSNTIGGGSSAAVALICKYTKELPQLFAVCGVVVAAGFLRLKDVLGQIKRSSTQKCLKMEFHQPPTPFVSIFVNFFPTKCPSLSANNGATGWSVNGVKIPTVGGGGGNPW